jgi:hypothetical protein
MSKPKRHTIKHYMVPRCDEHGQWWWGYQKVRMVKHPEWPKQLFLTKQKAVD